MHFCHEGRFQTPYTLYAQSVQKKICSGHVHGVYIRKPHLFSETQRVCWCYGLARSQVALWRELLPHRPVQEGRPRPTVRQQGPHLERLATTYSELTRTGAFPEDKVGVPQAHMTRLQSPRNDITSALRLHIVRR